MNTSVSVIFLHHQYYEGSIWNVNEIRELYSKLFFNIHGFIDSIFYHAVIIVLNFFKRECIKNSSHTKYASLKFLPKFTLISIRLNLLINYSLKYFLEKLLSQFKGLIADVQSIYF